MTTREKMIKEYLHFLSFGGKKLVAGKDYEIFTNKKAQERVREEALIWASNLMSVNSYEEAKKHNFI